MNPTPSLERLTDQALLCQFGELVHEDNHHTASLLRHIDAIDRRQLWAKHGHPSMFDFLVARHRMSESTAGKRIGAARTARRFPVLFDMVARGEIHLSGIHILKTHLTPENHDRVLAEAKHKTMRELEQLVARLAPQPDAPSLLRALPNRAPALPAPDHMTPVPTSAASATPTTTPTAPAPVPAPRRSPDPVPLAPGRYKLQVTLGEDACQKLKQLKDLLAHQLPNGDPAAIIERALDASAHPSAQAQDRHHRKAASREAADDQTSGAPSTPDSCHPRRSAARSMDARSRPLCFCGRRRSPLQRDPVPRVCAPASVGQRRREHSHERGVAVPCAQRARS